LALFSLLLAILFWFSRFLQRWIAPVAFFFGGALLLFLALLAAAKAIPGGSYPFLWALLASLLASITIAFRRSYRPILHAALLCLLAIPVLCLFVPLLTGFFQGLGFTSVGAPLLSMTLALLFLLLFPVLEPTIQSGRNLLPLLMLAAAAMFSISGAETTQYSAAHPKPSLLAYTLDADTGKALWASSVSRLDSWTAEYLGTSPSRGKLPGFFPEWYPIEFFQHEAPSIALAPPQAVLLDQSSDAATRTLHLRITSPRHGRVIHVGVSQGQVLNASVNGHDLGQPSEARWNPSGPWSFDYCNPGDGLDLLLHLQGSAPITLVLVDRASGLIPGAHLPPRPADSMPIHSGDQTMVRRSFTF
jgi:hypothetical protein